MKQQTKIALSAPKTALAALVILLGTASTQAQQTAYAIGNGGTTLLRFQTNNPLGAVAVGNFNGGASFLDGIDFRPLNGQLYGYLDSTDTLYTVNLNTATLTPVASGTGASATNTFQLGMDFNPTIDRVRVVTDSTQNLVYNPNVNAAPTVATSLFYKTGDVNQNSVALIIDNAYSNNIALSGLPTVQYGIDYGLDSLVTINNNAGDLTTVGLLGVDTDTLTGFDIYTSPIGVNTAYAVLGKTTQAFYTINLTTGGATKVSNFSSSFGNVYSLAVVPSAAAPEPGTLSLLGMAAVSFGAWMRKRKK